MNKKKIIIVIPAYQPDEKLVQLVEQLKEYKVVVVNDGSGDIYHEVFAQSKKAGAKVLSYSKNRGKGYALKHAFRRIVNSNTYAEWIITADADGQHMYFVKCFSQKSERKIPNFRNGIFPYISRKHFHMIVVQSVA